MSEFTEILSELNKKCQWTRTECGSTTIRGCDDDVNCEYMNIPKYCCACGGKIEVKLKRE